MDITDFATAKDYDAAWRLVENHHKGNIHKKRSWKMFQNALNITLKEFIPSRGELPIKVCLDDDKSPCAYQSLRDFDDDSDLSRQHHVKENQKGFNAH